MTPTQIRKLRSRLDLTQAELGKLMGLSARTVMRWEGGKAPNPTQIAFLKHLAKTQ